MFASLVERGSKAYQKNAPDKALSLFQQALQIKGLRPDQRLLCLDHVANCLFRLGRLEEAQAMACRMIQLQPTMALGYLRLGRLLGEEGGLAVVRAGLQRVKGSEQRQLLERAIKERGSVDPDEERCDEERRNEEHRDLLNLPLECLWRVLEMLPPRQASICSRLLKADYQPRNIEWARVESQAELDNLTNTKHLILAMAYSTSSSTVGVIEIPPLVRHLRLERLPPGTEVILPPGLLSLAIEGSLPKPKHLPMRIREFIFLPSDYQPLAEWQAWALERWKGGRLRLLAWWQLGLSRPSVLASLRQAHPTCCLLTDRRRIERLLSQSHY